MRDRFLGIVAGLLVLIGVGLTVGFFSTHQVEEKEVEVGYHGLARINPFLAAERTLDALGVPTQTWYSLGEAPAQNATVMVLSEDPEERERIHERLQDWIWWGGHVVAVAVPDSSDPFMNAAGAELNVEAEMAGELQETFDTGGPGEWEEPVEAPLEELVADQVADQRAELRSYTAWDPIQEEEFTLQAQVRGQVSSWRELETWVQDEEGNLISVSVVQGEGRVSILSDVGWFNNTHIGEHDHAALLMAVVADDLPAQIILVTRVGQESMGSLVLRHGWMVLLSVFVLLVGWVAKAAPRFGPMEPVQSTTRRSLLEHIQAAGAYHWRHGHIETLLAPARKAAIARVGRRHPELSGVQGVALVKGLAAKEEITEELAREILYGQPKGAARFTQTMAMLQKLGS
ncbi:MAG: hypothetical protein ACI9VR_001994 [Cognaticolwellia sp.]|jgi:hypothetical protein